ncbi:hypothetical protein MYX06_00165 [Patescibacteria group bacterium AH-259-L05]|nr:hypothetical protein [Patescibacteria group bacterium AH-259-L05]
MKKIIGLVVISLFLTNAGLGQTAQPEIWEVKIVEIDSTHIIVESVKTQNDSANAYTKNSDPYSYTELLIYNTVSGLTLHSALASNKNIGTETISAFNFILFGGIFILEVGDIIFDFIQGEKLTKERFTTLAVTGLVTGSCIVYFTTPGSKNPAFTRIVDGIIAVKNINHLAKKYAGK